MTPSGRFSLPNGRMEFYALLPPPGATGDSPAGAITLFEAFDRELGLKIGPGKHPMPVIVIDHMERTPSDN